MSIVPNQHKYSADKAAKILGKVLKLAKDFTAPAILIVEYSSIFGKDAVENALKTKLAKNNDEIVEIDVRSGADHELDFFVQVDKLQSNQVASVWGLPDAQPELIKRLNWRREFLVDNHKRLVFWLTTSGVQAIASLAPDFWDFRNQHIVLEVTSLPEKQIIREKSYVPFYSELEISNYSVEAKLDRVAALEELITGARDKTSERIQHLQHDLALLYLQMGKEKEAERIWRDLLALSRQLGNRNQESKFLNALGKVYLGYAQLREAIKHCKSALKVAQSINDKDNESLALGDLGIAYYHSGKIKEAMEYYQQALRITRDIGDKYYEGYWLGNLGLAYQSLGNAEDAIKHYQQALVVARDIGDKHAESSHLGNLGSVYHNLGKVEKAIGYYRQALELARNIGDQTAENIWLGNLGYAYSNLGEIEKAIALSVSALPNMRFKTNLLEWQGQLKEDFENIIRKLPTTGDTILKETTKQNYTFYRNTPTNFVEKALAMLAE